MEAKTWVAEGLYKYLKSTLKVAQLHYTLIVSTCNLMHLHPGGTQSKGDLCVFRFGLGKIILISSKQAALNYLTFTVERGGGKEGQYADSQGGTCDTCMQACYLVHALALQ